jgi:hypothetical protein
MLRRLTELGATIWICTFAWHKSALLDTWRPSRIGSCFWGRPHLLRLRPYGETVNNARPALGISFGAGHHGLESGAAPPGWLLQVDRNVNSGILQRGARHKRATCDRAVSAKICVDV